MTFDAVLTAFGFCGHIWNSADDHPKQRGPDHIWHTWDARTRVLIPEDDEALMYGSYSTSKLFAAVYPEAVSLAVIIASPHWRRVADARSPRERERFFQEISLRITYPYDDASVFGDAVAHWSNTDSWRPLSQPLRTYSPARSTGSPPPLHRAQSRRDEKSAAWFSISKRRVGATLLRHNHIRPVITREWRPDYERIDGAIWHSTRVDEDFQAETAREKAALGEFLLKIRAAQAKARSDAAVIRD
ncbi:hypothetical protein [Streptomyces bacillaris]|uniref:hypothetical protein n=1 Tax=Streptomyces bacillaris TaxID=68179 RepID=UPI0036F59CFC